MRFGYYCKKFTKQLLLLFLDFFLRSLVFVSIVFVFESTCISFIVLFSMLLLYILYSNSLLLLVDQLPLFLNLTRFCFCLLSLVVSDLMCTFLVFSHFSPGIVLLGLNVALRVQHTLVFLPFFFQDSLPVTKERRYSWLTRLHAFPDPSLSLYDVILQEIFRLYIQDMHLHASSQETLSLIQSFFLYLHPVLALILASYTVCPETGEEKFVPVSVLVYLEYWISFSFYDLMLLSLIVIFL